MNLARIQYRKSDPGLAGYPTLKRLHGKILPRLRGLPGLADRATRLERLYGQAGYPTLAGYSPTWGPPPPCKQALKFLSFTQSTLKNAS